MKYVAIFCLLVLSGCAFNNLFLYPKQLDREATTIKLFDYESEQKMNVTISEHFQPSFFDSLDVPMKFDYSFESVEFPNAKGKLLNGWFIKPIGKSNNITIYYLHGNGGNIYSNYTLMLPFVKKGFTVFMIDYSGFGYSEGKAKRKNIFTDGLAGFDYLKSRKDCLGDKLIVYGQSLGGHLTASLGHLLEPDVDAFVMEGAFSSHDEIAAKYSGLGGFARMMCREMYSGVDSISLIQKPKLIIHSTEDGTVPYYMGEQLFEGATINKSFYKIEGRHIFGPFLYADSIEFKILEMLK